MNPMGLNEAREVQVLAERDKEIVGGREKAKGDILYC